jgi:hypothetical protein
VHEAILKSSHANSQQHAPFQCATEKQTQLEKVRH